MVKPRILIVDDNSSNVGLIARILVAEGYEVRSAADAVEAMAAIEREIPQLILMDVQLPGLSGLELTRRLKADARTRHVIVVAVTGYATIVDQEKARTAGCNGYVTKPLDMVELRRLVAGFLATPPPEAD